MTASFRVAAIYRDDVVVSERMSGSTGCLAASAIRTEWRLWAVSIGGSRVDPSVCRDAENGCKEPVVPDAAICSNVCYGVAHIHK